MFALKGILSTLVELFQFMWHKKLWWLVPMVVMLLLFVVLIILGSTAGIGPFIYTLF